MISQSQAVNHLDQHLVIAGFNPTRFSNDAGLIVSRKDGTQASIRIDILEITDQQNQLKGYRIKVGDQSFKPGKKDYNWARIIQAVGEVLDARVADIEETIRQQRNKNMNAPIVQRLVTDFGLLNQWNMAVNVVASSHKQHKVVVRIDERYELTETQAFDLLSMLRSFDE